MRKGAFLLLAALALGSALVGPAEATIILDFETPATGSDIVSTPLVTPLGTITASASGTPLFFGVESIPGQGLTGLSLRHSDSSDGYGQLAFDFDVSSITFKWGGYFTGCFTAEALDSSLNVVASFFDGDTSGDFPGGPTTLSGSGIRYLRFGDYPGGLENAVIDDVEIEPVPEPGTLLLIGSGLAGLALRRRRRS